MMSRLLHKIILICFCLDADSWGYHFFDGPKSLLSPLHFRLSPFFILLKQFTVDMVSRLTNEALCVSLFQNSQKKRGARPNNKPDKKLAAQVRTKHTRTPLCFPPEGLTNQYETRCVAAWDTYSRRASVMRSYVCRFQRRRATFTELYHSEYNSSKSICKAVI